MVVAKPKRKTRWGTTLRSLILLAIVMIVFKGVLACPIWVLRELPGQD